MAVYKFSNVSGFKNYQRYNDFLAGNPAVQQDKGSMFPLGVFTLTSSQSTIEFTNIPQTYTHLQIRIMSITSAGSSMTVRFNSDSSSSYAQHQLYGDGSTAAASGNASQTSFYISGVSGSSTSPSNSIVDILDYRNTNKYTTARSLGGYDANGSGYVMLRSGLWMKSDAITSIQLLLGSGTYSQNTSAALYGVLA